MPKSHRIKCRVLWRDINSRLAEFNESVAADGRVANFGLPWPSLALIKGSDYNFSTFGVFEGNSDSVPKQLRRQSRPFRTLMRFNSDSNPPVLWTVFRTNGSVSKLIGICTEQDDLSFERFFAVDFNQRINHSCYQQ